MQSQNQYIELIDLESKDSKTVEQPTLPSEPQKTAPTLPPTQSPPAVDQPNFKKQDTKVDRLNMGYSQRGIPLVLVKCQTCTLDQLLEGTVPYYQCSICTGTNKVRPSYGLFMCGRCRNKSCYRFGVTNIVRCAICNCDNRKDEQIKQNG